MKRMWFATLAVAMSIGLTASAMTLVEARAKIGSLIATPKDTTAVMKQLSAADQKQFLCELNAAIEKLPGSAEEKAAVYLNVNHAALKGAQKGNLSTLVAETFATVSPDALTVINERFAVDLFNRAADPKVTYTDEQFTRIATELMEKINARTAETDNAAARSTFAILMLIRASNGSPADLTDKLVDTLAPDAREIAKAEWIPAALATGGDQSYEPILGAADAGRRPDMEFVLRVSGPQEFDAMLADLIGKFSDPVTQAINSTPIVDAVISPLNKQLPNLGNGEAFGSEVKDVREPRGYQWQSTHN